MAGAALLAIAVLTAACGSGSASGNPSRPASTRSEAHGPCAGSRPILYFEGTGCADGSTPSSLKTTPGAGNSWSPDGARMAFVSPNAKHLIVRTADDRERTIFTAPRKVSIVHRPAWSPDGSHLSVLLLDGHGFHFGIVGTTLPSYRTSLAVLDADTGRIIRRVALSTAVVHMPYLFNPPDTMAFSPDGEHVLVSWESPVVVDLHTGAVHRLWHGPAVAGWTSDGRVLFLDVVQRHRFGALHRWSPGGKEDVVWPGAQLRSNGIVAEHGLEYGELRASPDGSRLAIRTSHGPRTAVVVYALSGSTPGQRLGSYSTVGRIWDFDWSPRNDAIAAVVVSGATAEIRVLTIPAGGWTTIGAIPISVGDQDTITGLAPIKKLSWSD
jgi:Tol biopolymer transport system component